MPIRKDRYALAQAARYQRTADQERHQFRERHRRAASATVSSGCSSTPRRHVAVVEDAIKNATM